ncbi:M48 family metallopeptidase [Pseudactinotalea sp. HY158]|uniref:M48 metallopeptidase family protein n=1 Tax=Pseudactinotalea sp. HY158 TaxID=2654547 RepID=UPI00129D1471|nr:M48 family metallopeptidase [Pseudactinotalea sp. HY158]QGH70268.1 DUF45 domain-containing protein [Pseudactinotalea sp. HY158]
MDGRTSTIRELDGIGPVEVRRSARRRRTVSAFRESGVLVVAIPARFTRREEDQWIERMAERVRRGEARRRVSADRLLARALELAEEYLPEGVVPAAVTWVDNQNTRWGSCTPLTGVIRISRRVQGMPAWVLDYVLVHELAHLVVSDHSDRFWRIVDEYPRTERARGFLEGVSHSQSRGDGDGEPTDHVD